MGMVSDALPAVLDADTLVDCTLNRNIGQMVAVRRIGLEGLEEAIERFIREGSMARDENTLGIIRLECSGSLGQTLKAIGKLNEKLVASYVFKILEGLDYLHWSDVVHCDLKSANILTTKTGNVNLSNFGISLNLGAMVREIKVVAGTLNWTAPEVIELKGTSTKSDIWLLRCTVIGNDMTGELDWYYTQLFRMMFRIVEDECPPIPERFSRPLVAFLKVCFHEEPAMRPSAGKLFEHEWLKNWGSNKDLHSKMVYLSFSE
ncbi:kinase-like domain-containing protein [Lactarius quietus]|nr:kinase-like domain-containing protein [Lactarius quietus]